MDFILSLDNDMASHNILLSMPSTDGAGDDFHSLAILDKIKMSAGELKNITQDVQMALKFLHEHNVVCGEDIMNEDHIIVRKVRC